MNNYYTHISSHMKSKYERILLSYIELNAGLVGLGLTYVISLADMLQYTIRLSADVENTVSNAKK